MLIDGDFYFSGAIPKYEYIDSEGSYALQSAICYLMHEGKQVFRTDLFYNPQLHSVEFDVSGIISAYMNSHSIPVAEFSVVIEDAAGDPIDDVTFTAVSYKGYALSDPYEFLQSHFLNDFDSLIVPRHFKAIAHFYATEDNPSLDVYAVPENLPKLIPVKSIQCHNGLNSVEVDIDSILADAAADGAWPEDAIPCRVLVKAADRSILFHVVDRRPAFAIAFHNGFSLPEHFWSFGSWKRSSSVKGESAMVDGKLLTYGVTPEDSFELITHRMNAQQLMHGINFLSITPADITLFLGRQAFPFHGVVSEVKCDNDPFSGELSQVKLTATANSSLGVLALNSDEAYNIFTNPFNSSFQ